MSANPRKNNSYTVSFKLKVVQHGEKNGKRAAAKLFKVDRKRVREWTQNKSKLEKLSKTDKRCKGGGRTVRFADIEEKLMKFMRDRREAGVRVTGKSMRLEALRLHKLNGSQSFKASLGWFSKFRKRNNLSFRRSTHVAQHAVSLVDDRVDKFINFVLRMRRLRNYPDTYIGNMDETPVWFDMPGKSTLAPIGDKEVCVTSTGHEKQKITVTLAACGDGTKLAPLVHLPGVRPLPKGDIPNGIVVYMCGTGNKSWADEESIKFWLRKIWGVNNQDRRMLVWDSFRGHLTPGVKELLRNRYNTDMAVIPGGCTCKLQPADVSWNKPFKSRLSELYDEWLFSGPIDNTRGGNRRAPPKATLLLWIKQAWDAITPEVVRRSFKKCGITNNMDGTEDDLFQFESDSESEFEGFTADDVREGEQVLENIISGPDSTPQIELSEDSDVSSPSDSDDDTDCDSPGH